MTQKMMDYYLSFNVSAIFSFFNTSENDVCKKHLKEHLENVYSYSILDLNEDGTYSEDYLYFIFNYSEEIDEHLEKLSYLDKIYTDEYIVLKVDKWEWMSHQDWQHIKNSNYDQISGLVYDKAKRSIETLQYNIINKTDLLKIEFDKNCGIDIRESNIYWSRFNYEKEVLDLSKLTDMTILGYKKAWLEREMERASFLEKDVYKKILENSFEVITPSVVALGKNPEGLELLYERLMQEFSRIHNGKKQIQIDINGKKYPFLCNFVDFKTKLSKVLKKYKMQDMNKVEKCLVGFIREPKGAALLKYYIDKNNVSLLADDYFCENSSITEVEKQKSGQHEL